MTIPGKDAHTHEKRPDLVIYVNGIAVAVMELKRSSVSVAEGIRQNLTNQRKEFIQHFFATTQLLCAGNDTEGLRYGLIKTREKYYLTWKEPGMAENPLDRSILQMFAKPRLLELMHDLVPCGHQEDCASSPIFWNSSRAGVPSQTRGRHSLAYAGQRKVSNHGMACEVDSRKQRRCACSDYHDRTELDEQIQRVFLGVNEDIYRTKSGADLISKLNTTSPWLMCSLIHKFGGKEEGEVEDYVQDVRKSLPPDFKARGDL